MDLKSKSLYLVVARRAVEELQDHLSCNTYCKHARKPKEKKVRRFFCGPNAKKSAALAKQQKKKPKLGQQAAEEAAENDSDADSDAESDAEPDAESEPGEEEEKEESLLKKTPKQTPKGKGKAVAASGMLPCPPCQLDTISQTLHSSLPGMQVVDSFANLSRAAEAYL